ncbi:class I SAM-dependent methyltransferase [Nonomuraea sp. NPDC050394]|uniref:class I SAM-dependent methyltransferase n=1 Tax=Nonomuraea sp. NPDC050394 TaxID=3364363 RepID=UPI003791A411
MKQRLITAIIGQFHRPHGAGGHLAGWIMAHRASNRRRNQWTVSLLDVRPTDHILEIGFGPGLAIAHLTRHATHGTIYGIDHSAVMLRHATRRNAAAIRAHRVTLRQATAEHPPAPGQPLDAIVTINTFGMWPNPTATLTHLRTLLKPGGRIAITSQPRTPGATPETSAQAARDITRHLTEAGYTHTRAETLDLTPPAVCVLAIRP